MLLGVDPDPKVSPRETQSHAFLAFVRAQLAEAGYRIAAAHDQWPSAPQGGPAQESEEAAAAAPGSADAEDGPEGADTPTVSPAVPGVPTLVSPAVSGRPALAQISSAALTPLPKTPGSFSESGAGLLAPPHATEDLPKMPTPQTPKSATGHDRLMARLDRLRPDEVATGDLPKMPTPQTPKSAKRHDRLMAELDRLRPDEDLPKMPTPQTPKSATGHDRLTARLDRLCPDEARAPRDAAGSRAQESAQAAPLQPGEMCLADAGYCAWAWGGGAARTRSKCSVKETFDVHPQRDEDPTGSSELDFARRRILDETMSIGSGLRSVLGVPNPDAGVPVTIEEDVTFELLPLWDRNLRRGSLVSRAFTPSSWTPGSTTRRFEDDPQGSGWRLVAPANSTRRAIWDLISVVFILHDLTVAPLELMEAVEGSASGIFGWAARLFWTLDILASFLTGFLMPDGSSEVRLAKIAWNYASSWLIPDVLLVAADWIRVLADTTGAIGQASAFLRMARTARVLRLRSICGCAVPGAWSERMCLLGSILKSTGAVICVVHAMACLWIGIGLRDGSWIARHGLEKGQRLEQYIVAFHWSLNSLAGPMDWKPSTLMEQGFSIASLLIGFLGASLFVSHFTSSMTRISAITNKNSAMFTTLHAYLREHNISAGLVRRIQFNAGNGIKKMQMTVRESDVELLSIISEPLRAELHLEIYSPVLSCHPLFARIRDTAPRALQKICHTCVSQMTLEEGDLVFGHGEVPDCPKVLFITSGMLEYTKTGLTTSTLSQHEWVSEHILWTHWIFHGSMSAQTACRFAVLDARPFWHLASTGQIDNLALDQYATAFVERLNGSLSMRTDVGSIPECRQLVLQVYKAEAFGLSVMAKVKSINSSGGWPNPSAFGRAHASVLPDS